MKISTRNLMWIAVLAMFALGLVRAAASYRFRETESAIRKANQAELEKAGLKGAALKTKYPTPEIRMASGCLLPGGTGEAVVQGKFAPGTKFVYENDNLEVVKESLTPTEYRATLKAAPGIGPESATVVAYTPVSGISARQDSAVVVGGRYEWNLEATNGWKVVARSQRAQPCGTKSSDGDPYDVLFFRKGETNPFQKTTATLRFNLYDSSNYRFSVNQQADAALGMGDMETLMKRMMDPKLSDAERERVISQVEKVQANMEANMKKMTDPAYIKQQEELKQQFGCESLDLKLQTGAVTGTMRCAEKVGTRLAVTGSMAPLR